MKTFSHKNAIELYDYITSQPLQEYDFEEDDIQHLGSGASRIVFGFTSSDDGLKYAIKIPYTSSEQNEHYCPSECEEEDCGCECLWDDNGNETLEYVTAERSWRSQNIQEVNAWDEVKDLFDCFLNIVDVGDDFSYIIMPQAECYSGWGDANFQERAVSEYREMTPIENRADIQVSLFAAMNSAAESCGYDYDESFSMALDLANRAKDAGDYVSDIAVRNLGIIKGKGYII